MIERLRLLLITGGVPRYLEDINPRHTADENIRRMCFSSAGLLFHEYDQLLNDLFQRKNKSYRRIIEALANQPMTLPQLHAKLRMSKSGVLSARITELEKAGFVMRYHTWDTSSGEPGSTYKIRISDNYVRFYLKCIKPDAEAIEAGEAVLPGNLASILGLQFENLVIKNRSLLLRALRIKAADIVRQGPYFQTTTSKHPGCQIDYLIQTRHALFVVEIKFRNEEVGADVVKEVRNKVKTLVTPRNLSVHTVLVHVNGVAPAVREQDYFDHIIDFGALAFGS